MVTIRANNPVLTNRRIKRMAEPRIGYSPEFSQDPLLTLSTEVYRIWDEVYRPAFIEVGKVFQKWLEEHPNYGRN